VGVEKGLRGIGSWWARVLQLLRELEP